MPELLVCLSWYLAFEDAATHGVYRTFPHFYRAKWFYFYLELRLNLELLSERFQPFFVCRDFCKPSIF